MTLTTHDRILRRLAAGMNVILDQGRNKGNWRSTLAAEAHVHRLAQLMLQQAALEMLCPFGAGSFTQIGKIKIVKQPAWCGVVNIMQ